MLEYWLRSGNRKLNSNRIFFMEQRKVPRALQTFAHWKMHWCATAHNCDHKRYSVQLVLIVVFVLAIWLCVCVCVDFCNWNSLSLSLSRSQHLRWKLFSFIWFTKHLGLGPASVVWKKQRPHWNKTDVLIHFFKSNLFDYLFIFLFVLLMMIMMMMMIWHIFVCLLVSCFFFLSPSLSVFDIGSIPSNFNNVWSKK